MATALLAATCMRGSRPDSAWAPAVREQLPALSLVTADGVVLELLGVEARVLLVEPLAFTELHLRFRNPEARVLEGRFRVVLPPTGAVARFAMKVAGHWEEAELVELQQARQSYEMFLHRRQDPALLEQSAGNEFSARIFPIAAKEEKELILAYSEELVQPDEPYRLALKGVPTSAPAKITLMKPGAQGLAQQTLVSPPGQDFEHKLAGGDIVLRHADLVVGRVTAPGVTRPAAMRSLVVLVDTSASRALGLGKEATLLRSLLAEAQRQIPEFPLRVLAFDQEVAEVYDGPSTGFGDAQERLLLARGALGASNLELALRTLAQHLARKPAERILVIGDGVTTAGALDGATLQGLVLGLAKQGAKRLDAIVVGGAQDQARLAGLTVGGMPEGGAALQGARSAAWLWSRLTRQATSVLPLTIARAAWTWPREPRGVLPGDAMMVLARLTSAEAPLGLPHVVTVDPVFAPLLERAHARGRVAEAELELDETSARTEADLNGLKQRLIETSVAARVLSRLTGFVVLENDAAWSATNVTVAPTKLMSLDASGLHMVAHDRPRAGCCGPRPVPSRRPWTEMVTEDAEPDLVRNDTMDLLRVQSSRGEESEGGRGVLDMLKSAPASERGPSSPPTAPAKPPTPVEPAALADGAPLSGLPALPPEPRDGATPTGPDPSRHYPPRTRRQATLPTPPVYRASDYAKLPKAFSGRFGDVMSLIARGKVEKARAEAEAWRAQDPGQVLAQVALGEACRAAGDWQRAGRAFGSIIDLFPARADLRRFAAGRLASLKQRAALELAIDSAWRAVEERPDHPSGHHLAATLLLEAGRYEQALAVLTRALENQFPPRYFQADRVLREDAGLVVAAWAEAEPRRADELRRRLVRLGVTWESEPSLRFVLTWESDANDVDFHIRDGLGYHAFYARPALATGGDLYADVREGYGPECFAIYERAADRAPPYRLSVRYAQRGPMGYGMGTVQIIEHDGAGTLRFDHRPFVIMNDGGHLDLAEVSALR